MRLLDTEHCPPFDELVATHVARPTRLPPDRAFVRLNMIESVDGASTVAGLSGGLGNRTDHVMFRALRGHADGVLVGMGTVRAEHYGPPDRPDLRVYVVTSKAQVPDEPLFAEGRPTLVLPADAGTVPDGVDELRAGVGGEVSLEQLVHELAGSVIVAEGGPTLAGKLASLGLIDELFVTLAPRVIAGDGARIIHGDAEAEPTQWDLVHGFADDDAYLFLRYAKSPDRPAQSSA